MMRPSLSIARLSWRGQTSLVCGAFLLVGIAVVGDYGLRQDSRIERHTAEKNLAFITRAADSLDGFNQKDDKYYGVAF